MYAIDIHDIKLTMALISFVLGLVTFISGVVILVSGSFSRDISAIASQTTRLAQKGMAEEIAGLVGNASSLLNALNGMVHTRAGIGVFLTLTGIVLMGISYWLILKIQ
jgi:hypothetical protein